MCARRPAGGRVEAVVTAVEERRSEVGRRIVLPQLRAHADTIDPIAFEHFLTETAAGLRCDGDARGQGERPGAAFSDALRVEALYRL